MNNQLIWQDRFNLGIDFIDKEHKKLFGILNRLFTFSAQGSKSQWVCQEGIKYFKDHAIKHFTEEEVYMASIEYGDFEMHRRLHDNFRQTTLPTLERELIQTGYSPNAVNHFLGVCAGWLIGHTLTEDRAITGDAASIWVDLLPEEQHAALKQTILNLLYDLFQLKAHIVSEHYGGEKFGNGIYYRLVYECSQGKEWEFILVFEEKLLLNTIGKLINEQANEVTVMVMNATRYTSRQFIDGIRKHIPSMDAYDVKKENLLTYEQFQKIFESKRPQCSLLFDTGEGYFSFCVIAPHLLENGFNTSIEEDTAMSEIKKYLSIEHEKNTHKKILVVDDSAVVQESMKQLLQNDYQIAIASSGLSALRSLILDKPDLILLDYEMPVCDGRQVLEMIRAEQDVADIPVIFLTAKVDRESIKKVMSLKPAGYLSKMLQPADIKKNIDEFFARTAAQK